jgi:hypothetical protein
MQTGLGLTFGLVQKDRAAHVGVILSIKWVQDVGQFKRSVGIRSKNDDSQAIRRPVLAATVIDP